MLARVSCLRPSPFCPGVRPPSLKAFGAGCDLGGLGTRSCAVSGKAGGGAARGSPRREGLWMGAEVRRRGPLARGMNIWWSHRCTHTPGRAAGSPAGGPLPLLSVSRAAWVWGSPWSGLEPGPGVARVRRTEQSPRPGPHTEHRRRRLARCSGSPPAAAILPLTGCQQTPLGSALSLADDLRSCWNSGSDSPVGARGLQTLPLRRGPRQC